MALLNWSRFTQSKTIGVCFENDLFSVARVESPIGSQAELRFLTIQKYTEKELPELLSDTIKKAGAINSKINLVLPESAYQLLVVEAPNVERSELKESIRWKIKDLISFPVEDAVIDIFDLPHQVYHSNGELIFVVVAKREVLGTYIERLRKANLTPSVIDISDMAFRNLLTLVKEIESGVGFLHHRIGRDQMLIAKLDNIHMVRRLEVDMVAHNASKNENALALEVGSDFAYEKLTLEMQRSLDYYESHFGQAPVRTVYVYCDNGASEDKLINGVGDRLDIELKALHLEQLLDVQTELPATMPEVGMLAVGGALRAGAWSL